ncbi:MAG: hypothetical protein ACFFBV_15750, partial [Promethearchaeota archaeon]
MPGWQKVKKGDYFRLKYGRNRRSPDFVISVSISNPLRGDARLDLKGFDLHSICGKPGNFGY